MLTKLTIHHFKKLENLSFPLSQSVVIIGPNNSGKSTVFQALCLWEIGVMHYLQASSAKKLNKNNAVTLNRQNLLNSPIANMRFLWKDQKVAHSEHGKKIDRKIEITLEGEDAGKIWECKAEFYYYNEESFSCKIVSGLAEMEALYQHEKGIHFGFLQAMSGITSLEDKLPKGAIDRRLGEGKTAEVLRNICYEVLYPEHIARQNATNTAQNWADICKAMKQMFGANLQKPEYIKINGTIELAYLENGIRYDIASGGRGFQQTLLLLAYMFANPHTILLLDEPDAHLEVIRQREIFQLVNHFAEQTNSQIIIASHSEIVLEEAAEASKVIALIENQSYELNIATPSKSIQYIKKTLTEIGWEKLYLAKLKKHILFLEGSTDLQMLLAFAHKLQHPVESLLRFANVEYTADNVPNTAVKKYEILKEFFPELKGLALLDNINKQLENVKSLKVLCWQKRELENYFAKPALLVRYASSLTHKYPHIKAEELTKIMQESINNFTTPAYLNDLNHTWWDTAKVSEDWFEVIFSEFYSKITVAESLSKNYKKDFYQLIHLLEKEEISPEISEKLDHIFQILK